MHSFPEPALTLVKEMTAAAAADPDRAIAFQGAPGCNSHRAALEYDPDCLPLPCFAFEDALEAVKEGRAARAIIPIENSQHGRVADIHFLLPESGLSIVGEHFLQISYAVMALGQCRKFLKKHKIQPVTGADTAGSAVHVSEVKDKNLAAIASTLAGELNGLTVLAEDIEDADHNTTRFLAMSRQKIEADPMGGDAMTSFVFEVRNVPAALYKAMGGFATNGVNMTKLESYMVGGDFNATQFYADIEGHPDHTPVRLALEELGFFSRKVMILGVYPADPARYQRG